MLDNEMMTMIISTVAVIISIISFVVNRKHPPKIVCVIDSADNTQSSIDSTSDKDNVLLAKELRIYNTGRIDTRLYVDVWTTTKLLVPPSIHTSQLHVSSLPGYTKTSLDTGFGRYFNMQMPSLPPGEQVVVIFQCGKRAVEIAGNAFFERVSVGTSNGLVKCIDVSDKENILRSIKRSNAFNGTKAQN